MTTRSARPPALRERGQAVIEFVFVLILLMVLTMVMFTMFNLAEDVFFGLIEERDDFLEEYHGVDHPGTEGESIYTSRDVEVELRDFPLRDSVFAGQVAPWVRHFRTEGGTEPPLFFNGLGAAAAECGLSAAYVGLRTPTSNNTLGGVYSGTAVALAGCIGSFEFSE